MKTTHHIPKECYEGLATLSDWLGLLERSSAVNRPPSLEESDTLAALFERLWVATGMDASLGLARSTPDQHLFREKLGRYFYQSMHLERCFEKPRGYAGDYLMMEGVCHKPQDAATPMGRWLDLWFHDYFPPFVSVRNRRNMVAGILSDEHSRGAKRVLNVACGSAPELALLGNRLRFAEVALLDQDAEALAFAKSRLDNDGSSSTIRTICTSIRQLVESTDDVGSAQFDVVYSMGLYDYLSLSQARKLTSTLWRLVAPGGLLMVGNFQGHHWARYVMEAVMEWFLIYRDDDDMKLLGSSLPGAHLNVIQDMTGLLHLLQIRKDG